jgi:DNA-binding response OmpR family regulator
VNESEPASSTSVLVIEDDADIAKALETLLVRAGYEATVETDGRSGLRRFHTAGPDLVILDVGLPSLDGWTLLDRIRELSQAPVLMLTARDRESDKVRGLRGGADDYLTKPFGNQELLARVEAVLRRVRDVPPAGRGAGTRPGTPEAAETSGLPNLAHDLYHEHGVLIDLCCHRVEVSGVPVSLTPSEFRLVEALLQHRGSVLSTGQLLQLAWRDPTATGPDRVKFTVLRLRRKLGWSDGGDGPLETVRGFGYRLRR